MSINNKNVKFMLAIEDYVRCLIWFKYISNIIFHQISDMAHPINTKRIKIKINRYIIFDIQRLLVE